MRHYTPHVVMKQKVLGAFRLYPFPGKYPTRIMLFNRVVPLGPNGYPAYTNEFPTNIKIAKVLYLGKPSREAVINNCFISPEVMAVEFDRKQLIYIGTIGRVGRIFSKVSLAFTAFYHRGIDVQQHALLTWFTYQKEPIPVVRVGKYSAYDHTGTAHILLPLELKHRGLLKNV